MSNTLPKIVLEESENLIEGLKESGFFEDYEIVDLTYVRKRINEVMTEKFLDGSLDENIEELFTESEFETLLQELAAGSLLYELKTKGFVNSYEDENTEETFFLTEKGKKYLYEEKIQPKNTKEEIRDVLNNLFT